MPNLNSLYSFIEVFLDFDHTGKYLIPYQAKCAFLALYCIILAKFMHSRRKVQYFPLCLFLSNFSFFQILDYIHSKHFAYL